MSRDIDILEGGEIVVSRYRVLGSKTIVVEAYRRLKNSLFNAEASSLMSFDEIPKENGKTVWFGRIGSFRCDCDLPAGEERCNVVNDHYSTQHIQAIEFIRVSKFAKDIPETAVWGYRNGDVTYAHA